jgi:MoaA/NifB/PqqE/SkfB family radical SAM enzyme
MLDEYHRLFPLPMHPPVADLRRLDAQLPYAIGIEPTTACNARCVFCPVSQRRDDFRVASLDGAVLDGLVREMKTWPDTVEGIVQMVGLGEPTVARNFAQNLFRLREAKPKGFIVVLNTNGTTLHSRKIVSTIIQTVDRLTISINGYNEESYRLLNGINGFAAALENTVTFLREKNAAGFRPPATRVQIMRSVYKNAKALDAFTRRIKPVLCEQDSIHRQPLETLAGVEAAVASLQTPQDKARESLIETRAIPCFQLWYQAFITAEGDVYPCCVAGNVDGRDQRKRTGLCLGNLLDHTLYELWNGDLRKELMRLHLDDDKPAFCRPCPIVTEYNIAHWRTVERHAANLSRTLHSSIERAATG